MQNSIETVNATIEATATPATTAKSETIKKIKKAVAAKPAQALKKAATAKTATPATSDLSETKNAKQTQSRKHVTSIQADSAAKYPAGYSFGSSKTASRHAAHLAELQAKYGKKQFDYATFAKADFNNATLASGAIADDYAIIQRLIAAGYITANGNTLTCTTRKL